jgi:hypothetical protein
MKKKYEIGDKCWIFLSYHEGERTEGTVVHKFSLPGWCIPEHYVVEIPTPVDPLLEVHDPYTMRETSEG